MVLREFTVAVIFSSGKIVPFFTCFIYTGFWEWKVGKKN